MDTRLRAYAYEAGHRTASFFFMFSLLVKVITDMPVQDDLKYNFTLQHVFPGTVSIWAPLSKKMYRKNNSERKREVGSPPRPFLSAALNYEKGLGKAK